MEERSDAVSPSGVIADVLEAMVVAWSGSGAAGLRAWQGELETVSRMVAGHVASMVAEAEQTDAFRDDGHVSVRNWVMAETNCPRQEALHVARTARLISSFPEAGDELRAGRVGIAQVRELARVNLNPRIAGGIAPDVITEFLAEAKSEPYHGFVQLVRSWEALVDADGSHDEHDAAHTRRHVSLNLVDKVGHLNGSFGSANTAELMEILEQFARAEFLAEWEDLKARFGDDATPGQLERTEAQRRADALVAIFRRAAAADPGAKDPEPVVNLVVPFDVFTEQLRAMVEDRPPNFDAMSTRLRMCTSMNGVPVDPADAVIAALLGHVRRVVVDRKGVIIDMGRKRRLFTGSARDAALLQGFLDSQGRCIWPGCSRQRCEIDHSDEWAAGGLTDLINAALLCGWHNRFKTRGFRTWSDDAGVWHVRRPDGTELAAAA